MANRPRWIKAGAAYCEVQRTVDRQFFFKPDETTRNIIGSAAGRALNKYPVKIYWLDFNINHKQGGRAALSESPEHRENLIKFDQLFNSLVARGVNKHLGREGSLYSSKNRIAEATDDKSLEQQLLYAVTNPVKDGLVDRVAHWKGFSSYKQLATGEVERYSYIDWTAWHRAGGKRSKKAPEAFVKWVEVRLSPIPSWEGMPDHKRQALFRRQVRELEQDYRGQREREGRTAMGPRKLAKVDHRDRPKNPPKKRGRRPLCHSSTVEGAKEYKKKWREFLDQYYYASGMWMKGVTDVEFPAGSFRPPLIRLNL
jgi:putative transposase